MQPNRTFFLQVACFVLGWASICNGQPIDLSHVTTTQGTVLKHFVDPTGATYLYVSGAAGMDLDPGPDTVIFAPTLIYGKALVKLNAMGAFLWAQHDLGVGKVILLSDGNLLESYFFQGTIDADPGLGVLSFTSLGYADVVVRKVTSDGQLIWAKHIGNLENIFVGAIAEMPDESLVVAGTFSGTTTLDPAGVEGVHTSVSAAPDMYVLKLDANGSYMWSNSSGGQQSEDYTELTIRPNGNMLLTGYVSSAPADVDPGPGVFIVDPAEDEQLPFLLELDNEGGFVQASSLNSDESASILATLSNAVGELYIAGHFSNNVSFGSGTFLLEAPTGASFIAKYDPDGQFVWAKEYGDDMLQFYDLALDQNGNLITAGNFSTPFDSDPGPNIATLTSQGASDIFLINCDPDGNYHWSVSLGTTGSDGARSILISPSGAISLAGTFGSAMDFDLGPNEYTANGPASFIALYNESPCAGLHYEVNSFEPVLCGELGSVSGAIVGGMEPYSYSWDLVPVQTGLTVSMESPGPATITVSDSTGCTQVLTLIMNGVESQAFDLYPILVNTSFRAGEISHIWVDVSNAGCDVPDAHLQLVLPPLLSLSAADPPPTSVDGATLTWDLGEVAAAIPAMQVLVDVAVSDTATGGSPVCFNATLLPSQGDADTTNNMQMACAIVQNSYDPNDIQVSPLGVCDEGYVTITQPLRYTVRFQNTGNASALKVVVVDSLPPQFDASALRIIGYSHPMYTEVMPGNVARFIFNDIDLADSTTNEPASHGHVVFEVDPVVGVELFDQAANGVGIYFDYNYPVATNIVSNTFIDVIPTDCNTVGISDPVASSDRIVVQPNPCTANCYVNGMGKAPIDRIEVFNQMGLLLQASVPRSSGDVKLDHLRPGMYLVRVWKKDQISTVRFVVE